MATAYHASSEQLSQSLWNLGAKSPIIGELCHFQMKGAPGEDHFQLFQGATVSQDVASINLLGILRL